MKTKVFTAILILCGFIATANFTPKSTADTLPTNTFTASADTLAKYSVVAVGDTNIVDSWGDFQPRKFAVLVQDEENEPKQKKKKKAKQLNEEGEEVHKGNRAFIYTTIASTLIAILQAVLNCK